MDRETLLSQNQSRLTKKRREEPSSRSTMDLFWLSLCWLSLILVVYVLSIGPVLKFTTKYRSSIPIPVMVSIVSFYNPIKWAYETPLLHKPLGLYYPLWVPNLIDSKGNVIEK